MTARPLACVALSVALLALPGMALATNRSWLFGGSGSAATAANWLPAGVPAAADSLVFGLTGTRTISWDANVGASTSHTYRAGTTTLSLSAPHFISGVFRVGLLNGDNAIVSQSLGALAVGGSGILGNDAGSTAHFTVSGSNVLFQVQNAGSDLFVGQRGVGTLMVAKGGIVRVSDDFVLGNFAGSIGTADISGSSALNASTLETEESNGDVFVGNLGNGTLNVTTGGVLTAADDLFVGVGTTSSSSMMVTGAGSIATIKDVCQVASNTTAGLAAGTATLTANSGGTVRVQNSLMVGDPDGGTGTLHLNGGVVHTHLFTLDPTHGVIAFDSGTLRIDAGTTTITTPASFSVGTGAGTSNFEVIRGSAVTVTKSMFLGTGGTGNLLVDSGSTLTLPATFLVTSGNAGVIVDSASTVLAPTAINLGGSGSNTSLLIDHGSLVNTGVFECADEAGAVSNITVQGANSKLTFGGPLFVPGDANNQGGTADLTVSNGAQVAGNLAGSAINIHQGGRLHILTGGTVQAGGTMQIQGLLDMQNGSATVANYSLLDNGRIQGRGIANGRVGSAVATTRISAIGGPLTVGDAASSSGFDFRGTVEAGSQILTLRDLDNITLGDSTTVDGGTLVATGTLTSPVGGFVGASGVLQISKLINQGVLAFRGASPAQLQLTGFMTTTPTSTVRLRFFGEGPAQHDQFTLTGGVTLGGALELVFDPNGSYPAGVPITIMSFLNRTGTFPTLIVDNMSPAAFTVVYTATSIQILFNQAVAAEPGLPSVLSFTGRTASGEWPGAFELALPLTGEVHVAMYDVRGREVLRLADGAATAGIHRYLLPAGLARGVYFGRALVRGAPDALRTARVVVR